MKARAIHWLMVAPVHALLLAFIVLPSIYVAWISLNRWTYGQAPIPVGLANYAYIFGDAKFWRAFWNTFVVTNAVVYGELLLGLALALLMAGDVPAKRLVISILLVPYAITEVSAVVMWRTLLEPDIGLVNLALERVGLGQIDWSSDPVDALAVVSLLSIWHHVPFTFLILYAAVTTIPRELVEAAVVDGATPWQTLIFVKLRLILPALMIAVIFRYITAMRVFGEVWLLTEGGPARLTEVLAVYLYRQAFRYHEFGVAAATGFAMLAISLLIALPYLREMRRRLFAHAAV